MAKTLAVLALALAGANASMELTDSNFDAEVFDAGKNAFVKFLAPWWGHCKRMKPDWDSLAETYAGSTSVLIADVDCTTDGGKEACSRFEVRGYPTIKYFTAETGKTGEDYSGGRDLDGLKKFVAEKLAKQCLLDDTTDCDEKEVGYITKMKEKGADAAKTELTRLEGMKSGSMKPETKQWLMKRIAILKQM